LIILVDDLMKYVTSLARLRTVDARINLRTNFSGTLPPFNVRSASRICLLFSSPFSQP